MDLPAEDEMQGWQPTIRTPEDRTAVLERAFRYRGDVTLELADGRSLVGYVSNRRFTADAAWIEVLPAAEDEPRRRIPVEEIRQVTFTGRDTADGRSWEAWVKRWEETHGPRP